MSDRPSPASFYGERIPAQFNRALEQQQRARRAGRRVYEAMRAVDATIRVEVEGPGGGTFFLNIRGGPHERRSDAPPTRRFSR